MKNIFINTIVMLGDGYQDQNDFLKALAKLELPINGVEVRREYFSEEAAVRRTQLLAVLETGKLNNWELRYSVPESLFLEDGLNPSLSEWLEEAAILNAKSLKVNIGELAGIQRADRNALLNLPVKLTVENDQTPENGHLEEVVTALETIKSAELSVGYTFDLGNWQVMGEDAEKALQQTKDYITIFHLKNMDEQKQTGLLDDGSLAWREFLNPKWPIGLEYPLNVSDIKNELAKVEEAITNG